MLKENKGFSLYEVKNTGIAITKVEEKKISFFMITGF